MPGGKKGSQSDRDRKKGKGNKHNDTKESKSRPSTSAGSSKGGSSKSNATKNSGSGPSSKRDRELEQGELRSRPRIHMSQDTLWYLSDVLQKLKVHDEKNGNTQTPSGQEFQEKYASNLAANASANASKSSASTTSVNELTQSLSDLYLEKRDPALDDLLKRELQNKERDSRYVKMQNYRGSLPAYDCKKSILDNISRNQVIVICGETGSGKTTQVCQYVLDDAIMKGEGSLCKILCTQPRRISAISVAERVADERCERVGNSVGYSVRLDARLPTKPAGCITFVTTGVVFQYLKDDPNLSRVSMVIVDEVHERDILTDFLLVILKDLLPRRPDLKVILMSATLNAGQFSTYFHKCPTYNIPGFLFEVEEHYLEDIVSRTRFVFDNGKEQKFNNLKKGKSKEVVDYEFVNSGAIKEMERKRTYSAHTLKELRKPVIEGKISLDLIQALIWDICEKDKEGNGAILVFMPGWDAISSLHKQLYSCGKFPQHKYIIIPLHSLVPSSNQREVFNKPPPGKRKIIISTNIAETSITVDDVVYVIDSGRVKVNNFDIKRNMETLDLEWIGRANRKQRKGRAGRVQAGHCFYLYTRARESSFEEFKKPEILRKRLEEVILQIKMLKLGKAAAFLRKMMDPPEENAVTNGVSFLQVLGALDQNENLTPLGFHLAHLPMDPQTGKMILLGALFQCVDPIFSIAASLSFKDAFYTPMGRERAVDKVKLEYSDSSKSDHMVMVRAIRGYEEARERGTERDYCYQNFLSQSTLSMLINLKSHFASYLYGMKFLPSKDCKDSRSNRNSDSTGIITGITAAGLYPNVAQAISRGKSSSRITNVYTLDDGLVHIHMKSVNSREKEFEWPFLVYHHKMKSNLIYLHDTTMVSPFPLVFFGGDLQFSKDKKTGGTISIGNGRIRLSCEKGLFEIVDALRKELDKFLTFKIQNPGPTQWSEVTRDGILLRAIIKLITSEYSMYMNESDNFSSSEDDENDFINGV